MAVSNKAQSLGLTVGQTQFAISVESYAMPQGRGTCVYLREVHAKVDVPRIDIYVANDFAPGSCAYQAILDHENEHAAIHKDVVLEIVVEMRAELERLMAMETPTFVVDPKPAADRKIKELTARFAGFRQRIEDEQARRHRELEARDNSAVLNKRCSDWGDPPPRRVRR